MCVGKLIICHVTGIAHRRPNKDQLEVANPVRNDETGLWQCPFCDKKDFPELSEVILTSNFSIDLFHIVHNVTAGHCKGLLSQKAQLRLGLTLGIGLGMLLFSMISLQWRTVIIDND